jgi:hypothetical protein
LLEKRQKLFEHRLCSHKWVNKRVSVVFDDMSSDSLVEILVVPVEKLKKTTVQHIISFGVIEKYLNERTEHLFLGEVLDISIILAFKNDLDQLDDADVGDAAPGHLVRVQQSLNQVRVDSPYPKPEPMLFLAPLQDIRDDGLARFD